MANPKFGEVAPVLVLFFNRPSHLKSVLDRLVSEGLNDVYFASDGPRNQADEEALDQAWSMVEVAYPKLERSRTLRRKSNLGCRIAVSDALNWFYSQVASGIVIEEDCVPSANFFKILSQGLVKLEANRSVFCINATNPLPGNLRNRKPYLSVYPQIWGWATWADRWQFYKRDFSDSSDIVDKVLRRNFSVDSKIRRFYFKSTWRELLKRAGKGEIDTWDYSMLASMWRNDLYAVQLTGNYIINNGFEDFATHTKVRPYWAPRVFSEGQDNSLSGLKTDVECDRWLSKSVYGCNLPQIMKNFLKIMLKTMHIKP